MRMAEWLALVTVCVFPVGICLLNFVSRTFHTSPHFLEDNSKIALSNITRLLPYYLSLTGNPSIMDGHFIKRRLCRRHSQQNSSVMKAPEERLNI